MTLHEQLISKIESKQAVVGVIGLGRAGLQLALSFAEKRFRTIGFDPSAKTIDQLMSGESPIRTVHSVRVKAAVAGGYFTARTDFKKIWECDAVIIAVPTPRGRHGEPDCRRLAASTEAIAPYVRRGKLIVVESSAQADLLQDIMVPILERGGLKAGSDFFVAFSPELSDDLMLDSPFSIAPKIVGATTTEGMAVADKLYHQVIISIVPIVVDLVVGAH